MTNENPTVSVVMATYNGEKYIKEQLDSILAQTYPIYELIIQDDCSTDSTPAICREYEAKYPCVHFHENEHNLGFNLNFQTASMRATGDFVALSDQDDIWFKDKIAKQVATIGNHDICFSAHLRGIDMEHTHIVSPQYSLEALLFAGFAGHTMLLRRDFIQKKENWLPHFFYDWGLAVCAQLNKGIIFIEEPLNWHRSNDDSACSSLSKFFIGTNKSNAITPYLKGWKNYRRLQKEPAWRPFYSFILEKTEGISKFKRVHKMAGYMLSNSPFALLRLCCICLRHRDIIYPSKNQKGIKSIIRGFFYPFIFAYNNYQYSLKS